MGSTADDSNPGRDRDRLGAGGRPVSGYLPTLDGWRALAILGVLLRHSLPEQSKIGQFGAKGVPVFFAISGLLICSRLLREWDQSGRIRLKNFYIRRGFRILPPYMTYLLVLVLVPLVPVSPREWWACFFFVRNYIRLGDDLHWYTGHFWSLAVEEHFYMFFPFLLLLLRPGRALWPIAGLALAFGIWREVDMRTHVSAHIWPNQFEPMHTDENIHMIFWGCWMALLLERRGWRERLGRRLTTPVVLALGAVFLAAAAAKLYVLQAILVPFLLVGTVLHPRGPIGLVLESAPLRWVGRLSYSLYIWQQLFFVSGMVDPGSRIRSLQALPWNIAPALACACASYYLIERPFIRVGHALTRRPGPKPPARHPEAEPEPTAAAPHSS
ncbi:MAG TPA: acyltransferase [Isosphaeraceae bacterium]|jgi:peptidoglycan/LPS O-acetylase OafA/YrhL|nr:acyltransferase [Isosphaeraceae bacterium]